MKRSTLVFLWLVVSLLASVSCQSDSLDLLRESNEGSGEEDQSSKTKESTSVPGESEDKSNAETNEEDEVKVESESESESKPADLEKQGKGVGKQSDEMLYDEKEEEQEEEEEEEDAKKDGLIFLTTTIHRSTATPPDDSTEEEEEVSGDGEKKEETSEVDDDESRRKGLKETSFEPEDGEGKQNDGDDKSEDEDDLKNEHDSHEKNEDGGSSHHSEDGGEKSKLGEGRQMDGYEGSGSDEYEVVHESRKTESQPRNRDSLEEDKVKTQDDEHVWSYQSTYGPGNWSKYFSNCNNDAFNQSPINLVPEEAQFVDNPTKITLTNEQHDASDISLINTGKTAKVVFSGVTVRVLGLASAYRVDELNFHWGQADESGSEHTVNGKRYPLEMQIVCFDEEQYNAIEEAEFGASNSSSKGLLNLAVLFEVSAADNPTFKPIIDALESVRIPGENVSVESFDVKSILPVKSEYFFRYTGSTTAPPCSTGVDWIVFQGLQTISQSQLTKFRKLHAEELNDGNYTSLENNWRPVQPRNGRSVTRSFPVENPTPIPPIKPVPSKTEPHTSLASPVPIPSNISFVLLSLFTWNLLLLLS